MPLAHPDVHRPWAEWSEEQTLHVAACYSNPFRWRPRRELANDFRRHMAQSPNVILHMGELAYGDRPHEVVGWTGLPEAESVRLFHQFDVPLRTGHELFHKENVLNRAIETFPQDWKYGAWIDADFHFTRHDWALEAIHLLQHYDWVQLFSSYADLTGEEFQSGNYGLGHLPMRITPGFAYNYIRAGYQLPDGYTNGGWREPGAVDDDYYLEAVAGRPRGVGATGGAWAFRRSAFDTVGGLLDICILGHSDWFSAFGLVGEDAPDMHIDGYTDDYRNAILAWQKNAARLKKNIGYLAQFAVHHFHGSKARRGYATRDQILVKHNFSPTTDLRRDWQGVYQLTPDKPALRDAIRSYFISRDEQDPNLYGPEKPAV